MSNLLNKSEKRRLQFVEILSNSNNWVSIENLSEQLGVSSRLLKEDLMYLRNNFDEFTLQTANEKVRIIYPQNKGLKNVYQHFLNDSTAYQLLEAAFVHEGKAISELEEILFISQSTIYRLIQAVNKGITQYNFKINTKPFSITGKEKKIRAFFYQYFYEKYAFTQLPFFTNNEQAQALDDFLIFQIGLTQLNNDFAYYSKFKIIISVNLMRYNNNHFVDVDNIILRSQNKASESTITLFNKVKKKFEHAFTLQYDDFTKKQLFGPYLQDSFSLNYNHLMEKVAVDDQVAQEVAKIKELLTRLSFTHSIPLLNLERMISAFHNIIHLSYLEPDPGYILYNRNKYFVAEFQDNYPDFYQSLYDAMKELRCFLDKPLTEAGISFYIYTAATYWKGLIPALRKKLAKIRVLVISDRHVTHAKMIQTFITFEFSGQIEMDIYTDIALNKDILEALDYDVIVANFLLPELASKHVIYIKNVPDHQDLENLQQTFYEINQSRMNEEGYGAEFINE